mmetsp:Transcript_59140/g.70568  ORF Transcript_59140/g.70568 Transcript_59140/m.70568 type:complete len:490 (-) Transcript_59140:87-1556(-)|eukprot:CAMPEP_0172501078 /NCGR_PEP_ID=MMETSP1066-20121228/145918_1 /TAXON_ID=671091 /ORGANISM="Coscinodiscus wailesii, Strain CCMP2513" /LENGTH=489 /DNA_ID=CAMNT_0013275673 /DNA_START=88 /DNA_END=1557 /DNA_ORIENTATION=+
MKFLTSHALLTLLFISPLTTNGESDELPSYVGPKFCPGHIGISGYSNTTILHTDMIHDARAFTQLMDDLPEEDKKVQHVYVLCPDTTFDMGSDFESTGEGQIVHPLIPLLSNTVFRCGYEGRLEDNCVIHGGRTQVHFFDFLITEHVLFEGLTFTANEGIVIYASGNTFSSVILKNCLIQDNTKGFNTLQIYFDGDVNNRALSPSDRFHKYIKKYNFDTGVDKSVYTNLASANIDSYRVPIAINNSTEDILERVAGYEGTIPFHLRYGDNNRGLARYDRGMAVVLFATDIIDNVQDKAMLMNIAGTLEVINSDVSFNEAGFAVVTSVLGARLFMHTDTYFNYNTDKVGPVFIDNKSFLYLNQDVHGENNRDSACDIFLESADSSCVSEGASCNGTCCGFGDESCDIMTSEPTLMPQDVGNLESSLSTTSSSTCGALCISLSCLIPLVVLAVAILIWRRHKTGVRGRTGEVTVADDLTLEPVPNDNAIHA